MRIRQCAFSNKERMLIVNIMIIDIELVPLLKILQDIEQNKYDCDPETDI